MNDRRDVTPSDPARRRLLLVGAGIIGAAAFGLRRFAAAPALAAEAVASDHFDVVHSDAEWRSMLTPEQYAVLRQQATERPFTSPLDHEKRAGTFACAGCDHALFASSTKFDSGTGWPSFYQPLASAVNETGDNTLGILRTEVHCRRCGGHLGHVFDDGPQPTGLRYCMNGVAMKFDPDA
jgi:peptide-methionine (R)-S-oxide reductase